MEDRKKYIVKIQKQDLYFIDLEVESSGDEEQAQTEALEYVESNNSLEWNMISSTIYCSGSEDEDIYKDDLDNYSCNNTDFEEI